MAHFLDIDPDVKVLLPDGTSRPLSDYLWPTTLMMAAALLLVASLFLPYWRMTLKAPQYPKGLTVALYLDGVEGDAQEIDGLNHYLGMPSLNEGGKLERKISLPAIAVMALLITAGVFVHNRWAGVLAVPAIAFPFIFLLDLKYILYQYGHSIDPHSPLGGAIKPFTPVLLGQGTIGQFGTVASVGGGLWLALAASAMVTVGLYFHRRAYRAIVIARQRAGK